MRYIKKKRKGMTLVEIVVSLILMSLLMVLMLRLTAVSIKEQASATSQLGYAAIDAYMYHIYDDFHKCKDLAVSTDASSNTRVLKIVYYNNTAKYYTFNTVTKDVAESGKSRFKVTNLTFVGNKENLNVTMTLSTGNLVKLNLYR